MLFTPKHVKLLNNCYTADFEVSTNLLLHHIQVKPERLIKVTEYLTTLVSEEIIKSGTCNKTCRIMHIINEKNAERRVLYEVNVFKMISGAVNTIVARNKLQFNPLQSTEEIDRLNKDINFDGLISLVVLFTRGMKSYDGEIQAGKTLIGVANGVNSNPFLARLLCEMLHIRDIFNNDYELKIRVCIDALAHERFIDRLTEMTNIITIVNVRVFCYEVLRIGSLRNINTVGAISNLKKNLCVFGLIEINNLLGEMHEGVRIMLQHEVSYLKEDDKISASETTELEQTYEKICKKKQGNTKNLRIVLSESLNHYEKTYPQVFTLFRWSLILMEHTHILHYSIAELGQSYFTFLKHVFNQDIRLKEDLKPDIPENTMVDLRTLETTLLNTYKIPDRTINCPKMCFIFTHMNNFLYNTPAAPDILYIFIKKAFQYDFAPLTQNMTVYTLSFQGLILKIVKNYTKKYNLNLEPKLISLLIKICERSYLHQETCYSIFLNTLMKSTPVGETRLALYVKIRALYFKTGNNLLYKILQVFIQTEKDQSVNEITFFVLKHVALDKGTYNELNDKYKNLHSKIDNYHTEEDETFYDKIFGSLYKFYTHSLKSNFNMKSISERRKSMLGNLDFHK